MSGNIARSKSEDKITFTLPLFTYFMDGVKVGLLILIYMAVK